MTDKNNATPSGKIIYNSSIVKSIIVLAVSEVEGVALKAATSSKNAKDDLKIDFEGENVSVDVSVSIIYGYNIPDVAYNIQQSIKHSVEAMSSYKIDTVDVHVVDIIFETNEHNEEHN